MTEDWAQDDVHAELAVDGKTVAVSGEGREVCEGAVTHGPVRICDKGFACADRMPSTP